MGYVKLIGMLSRLLLWAALAGVEVYAGGRSAAAGGGAEAEATECTGSREGGETQVGHVAHAEVGKQRRVGVWEGRRSVAAHASRNDGVLHTRAATFTAR